MNTGMQPAGSMRLFRAFAGIGAMAIVAGTFLAPARMSSNLLLVSYFLLGIGLAAAFFVALEYVTGAGWSVALRRVPEAASSALPAGAAGLILFFILGSWLYPWTHEQPAGFKALWLDLPFFLARAVIYLAVWMGFAWAVIRNSRRQDADGDLVFSRRNTRLSVIFLFAFAVTFSLASFDWIMALEPHWASTIFGVYNFAGLFSSGLAVIILLVIRLRNHGPLRDFVNQEHLHDLGKLLFAFSTFWMYIWFSQYMLVWYANITEEAVYYVRRQQGLWTPLFLLNMLLNWAIPFLVLLPKSTKRNPGILAKVAVVVLAGRWLDLYLMIVPAVSEKPAFGIWEAALGLGALGVFMLAFTRAFSSSAPVPVRDPNLIESLHYHN